MFCSTFSSSSSLARRSTQSFPVPVLGEFRWWGTGQQHWGQPGPRSRAVLLLRRLQLSLCTLGALPAPGLGTLGRAVPVRSWGPQRPVRCSSSGGSPGPQPRSPPFPCRTLTRHCQGGSCSCPARAPLGKHGGSEVISHGHPSVCSFVTCSLARPARHGTARQPLRLGCWAHARSLPGAGAGAPTGPHRGGSRSRYGGPAKGSG